MFWKLQENALTQSDLRLMISFIRKTQRFTQAEKVREFEMAFAQWQGCKFAIFVNSGSSANLVLISALKELHRWPDDAEIIVPAVTWPTSVAPIIQCRLKPVFVDVNLTDLSIDCRQAEQKIGADTCAIFVTHLLGFPANISKLKQIIANRDIRIIEDCCQSHGASLAGIKVGNWGDAGTFSFYWGHHITSIEGGMICTNNEDLFELMVLKRSHGLARELPAHRHRPLMDENREIDFQFLFLTAGFNVRNTELNAVVGCSQLTRLDNYIDIRNNNYRVFLSICEKYLQHLMILDPPGRSSYALPFLFRDYERKQKFMEYMRAAGIESRPLVSGNLLRQPFLQGYLDGADYPNADFLHTNAFYIGNNQFVNEQRLDCLENLMGSFFSASV